jgi:hypothetical protein
LRIEHVAHHGHSRRPLRHPPKICVAELGHPAAAAAHSREHDFHRRRRHRVFLCHLFDQIAISDRHFVIPYLVADRGRAPSGRCACRWCTGPRVARPMTLIGADGPIGEGQPTALPRRIMVSMVSLRNRLEFTGSPSSPARSRYSQAIWNESSSS